MNLNTFPKIRNLNSKIKILKSEIRNEKSKFTIFAPNLISNKTHFNENASRLQF